MNYSLVQTVPPSEPVLTMAEARMQLRVDTFGSPPVSYEDDLISGLISAVTAELDAGTGWLGRALAPQTWQLGLRGFPADNCRIVLPFPPLISVESVAYTDTDGNVVPLTAGTEYRIQEAARNVAYLLPPFEGDWPVDARTDDDALLITFRAGYAIGSPEAVAVPELIKNVLKSMLTSYYDSRGSDKGPGLSPNMFPVLNSIRVMGWKP